MDWTNYVDQLYAFALDAEVFGTDPLHALKPFGMALWRTHSEMTKADEFFVQNMLGFYREQLDFALELSTLSQEGGGL